MSMEERGQVSRLQNPTQRSISFLLGNLFFHWKIASLSNWKSLNGLGSPWNVIQHFKDKISHLFFALKKKCTYLWKKSTMHYQNFFINAMTQWQPIINFSEQVYHIGRILSFDLSFKPIHFVHIFTLMVSTWHKKMVRIQELTAQKDENTFDGKTASVHKIAVK